MTGYTVLFTGSRRSDQLYVFPLMPAIKFKFLIYTILSSSKSS